MPRTAIPISIVIVCLLLRFLFSSSTTTAVAEDVAQQPMSPNTQSAQSGPVAVTFPPSTRPMDWTDPRTDPKICPDDSKIYPDQAGPRPQCDTSEEYPPITVRSGWLIGGFRCISSYCDYIGIGSENIYVPYAWWIGDNYWTPYFSEEKPWNARECADGHWMTGISCKGSYCDDISLQCTEVFNMRRGTCNWGPQFSEEDQYYIIPGGSYAVGIACFGSYCDNKSVKYCQLTR